MSSFRCSRLCRAATSADLSASFDVSAVARSRARSRSVMFPAACNRRLTSQRGGRAPGRSSVAAPASARSPDAVECMPDLGREIEHGTGDPELGLLESGNGHAFPDRDVQSVEEADHHGELQVRSDARQRKQHRGVEDRIPEESGLHQIRLGQSEIGVHGLEVAIVQHRDLYRLVGGEPLPEQRPQPVSATSWSSSVPRFHTIFACPRSSTAALTSVKPALRFTEAQPPRPTSSTHSHPIVRPAIRWPPCLSIAAFRCRRSPGAAHRS